MVHSPSQTLRLLSAPHPGAQLQPQQILWPSPHPALSSALPPLSSETQPLGTGTFKHSPAASWPTPTTLPLLCPVGRRSKSPAHPARPQKALAPSTRPPLVLSTRRQLSIDTSVLFYFIIYWPCCKACEILAPDQGLNVGPGSGSAEN